MEIQNLKEILNSSIVKFKYYKKDGTEREAIGTTNKEYLTNINFESKGNITKPDNIICYFDIEKQEWRSFIFENFISVSNSIKVYIKNDWQLNSNEKVVNAIIKRCFKNFGECPCSNPGETLEDRLCPCKEYREYNNCHCNLYVKK